jgi:hypothetical protein
VFSHVSPLLPLYLSELVFGLLYALLIHWITVNGYLKGSTAWSVVIGDAATLLIQWLFLGEAWAPLATFGSFACSGMPMVVSYLYRHQKRVESHKRRPWPNEAARVRDDAVMELTSLADEIARKTKDDQVRLQDLPDWVNRLHLLRSLLKSV